MNPNHIPLQKKVKINVFRHIYNLTNVQQEY